MSNVEKEIQDLASKYQELFWDTVNANLHMDLIECWKKFNERARVEKELEKRLGRKTTTLERIGLKKAILGTKD